MGYSRKKYVAEPDWIDVSNAADELFRDWGLCARYEIRVGLEGRTVICRCYREGAIRRADVVVQSKTTVPLASTRSVAVQCHAATLDCYMQVDRLRPERPPVEPPWLAELPEV